MRFMRHIFAFAAAILLAAQLPVSAQETKDTTIMARLLNEVSILQESHPAQDSLAASLPPLADDIFHLSDDTEEAAARLGVSSEEWRQYADKTDRVVAMVERINRLKRLVDDKKARAENAIEPERSTLLGEVALLEELIPVLSDQLSVLIKERDAYEIRFVGGGK